MCEFLSPNYANAMRALINSDKDSKKLFEESK